MNWIEENKIASTIMGVAIVASGILVFLGRGANSDAEVAKRKEAGLVKKIDDLQAAIPYPNKENEQLLAENLAVFAAETKKFQDQMLTFRPEAMTKLSANEFSGEVSNYTNKLKGYYQAKKIALPDKQKCYFGMEEYATKMADERTTSYLSYNRQALEWLFTTLADSGIDALNNVYRAPVAEGLATAPVPVAPKAPVRPAPRRGAKAPAAPAPILVTSVYDGLPIEITFTGTEASLEKFISDVAACEEYLFSLKYLKVLNAEQDPVVISKATFPPVATSPEDGEAPPADGEAPPADGEVPPADGEVPPADGEAPPAEVAEVDPGLGIFEGGVFGSVVEEREIIKQVIGDEKITAFLMFELVLFKEESKVIIPRLVTESPEKGPTK